MSSHKYVLDPEDLVLRRVIEKGGIESVRKGNKYLNIKDMYVREPAISAKTMVDAKQIYKKRHPRLTGKARCDSSSTLYKGSCRPICDKKTQVRQKVFPYGCTDKIQRVILTPVERKSRMLLKSCPSGKERSVRSGGCVKLCKTNQIRNPTSGRCSKSVAKVHQAQSRAMMGEMQANVLANVHKKMVTHAEHSAKMEHVLDEIKAKNRGVQAQTVDTIRKRVKAQKDNNIKLAKVLGDMKDKKKDEVKKQKEEVKRQKKLLKSAHKDKMSVVLGEMGGEFRERGLRKAYCNRPSRNMRWNYEMNKCECKPSFYYNDKLELCECKEGKSPRTSKKTGVSKCRKPKANKGFFASLGF
jgi:hypothetical protein